MHAIKHAGKEACKHALCDDRGMTTWTDGRNADLGLKLEIWSSNQQDSNSDLDFGAWGLRF